MTKTKNNNDKLVSILSYLLIGIIWYAVDEKVRNKKTQFHTRQALNLFIIQFVTMFILSILAYFLGWFILAIVRIFFFILWLIGIYNAITQNQKEIPIIGEFANKYLNI